MFSQITTVENQKLTNIALLRLIQKYWTQKRILSILFFPPEKYTQIPSNIKEQELNLFCQNSYYSIKFKLTLKAIFWKVDATKFKKKQLNRNWKHLDVTIMKSFCPQSARCGVVKSADWKKRKTASNKIKSKQK